jgi:comEA protein
LLWHSKKVLILLVSIFVIVAGGIGLGLTIPSSRSIIFEWVGGVHPGSEAGKVELDNASGFATQRIQTIEMSVTHLTNRLQVIESSASTDKQEVQLLKDQLKAAIGEVIKSNELLAEQKKQWEVALKQEADVQATVGSADSSNTTASTSITPSTISNNSTLSKKGLTRSKVNINTASAGELHTLPGIGPALAQRIISYRNKKGAFHQISELLNVKGIKQKELDKIKDSIVL